MKPRLPIHPRAAAFIFFLSYSRENKTLLQEKKTPLLPFLVLLSFTTSRAPLAAGPSSFARLLPRPSHKQKMRARSIRREPAHHVYRTCSKKRRLPAQENTRRHARLSRICFGRNRRPASTTTFFLSPFLQRKRKKKTEVNSAGSNTSFGLTSFVLTMYALARRASSAETNVAKNADFCKIFDTPYISLQDLARRCVGKCSQPTKDQYLGVNKASRSLRTITQNFHFPDFVSSQF